MSGGLEHLLATREIVVTCGAGGVGKTTTAAALATLAASRLDARVLVLTVDPARRLANALGLEALGNREARVPDAAFEAAGLEVRGQLWAAMLDMKHSWDELVERHAPSPKVRDELLANEVYANISGRFVQSHSYIAAERLYDLHSTGGYDLIVVDTPPSRSALDFLDAPARMVELFEGRMVRWLTMPARHRVLGLASKPFFDVADRILGSQLLGDVIEFFSILQSMAPGFVERADAVGALLADRRSAFVVVTTLEASPARDAEFLLTELGRRHLSLGAVVLNKVLPASLLNPDAGRAAARLRRDGAGVAAALGGDAPEITERVLQGLAENFANLQSAARLEAQERERLAAAAPLVCAIPYLDDDITDLAGLARLLSRVET
ncbi:MAG: oxyanion-translocating ATPase [Acidimicrobiia bacterium]|nr:oxyanion-translocating ATPase [Acidimicrobiia bacterium]